MINFHKCTFIYLYMHIFWSNKANDSKDKFQRIDIRYLYLIFIETLMNVQLDLILLSRIYVRIVCLNRVPSVTSEKIYSPWRLSLQEININAMIDEISFW